MKKYFQWKNIVIGKIDQNHPSSKEVNKAVEETLTSVSNMINDLSSATDRNRK